MLYFSETDEQQQLQTKQGRALGVVLGITTEVLQFDKARKKLKASRNNEDLIQVYLYITAVMETRVSQSTYQHQNATQGTRTAVLQKLW